MNDRMKFRNWAAAALIVTAGSGQAARAADPGEVSRAAVVTAAGLDLSTAAGQAALHRRILHGAVSACSIDDRSLVYAEHDDFQGCVARSAQGMRGWAIARIAEATEIATATKAPPVQLAEAAPAAR